MEVLQNEKCEHSRNFREKMKHGYFAELDKSKDHYDLSQNILNIIRRLGFSDYSVINLDCLTKAQYKLSTLPKSLIQTYFQERLFTEDMTIEQVANKLNISIVTANQHLRTIRTKFGVKSNHSSIRLCIQKGFIKYNEAPK